MTNPAHTIVTRIAPSPTGLFHIGTARTALFNFLFARSQGGRFLVRIEDTDRLRSKKEYEDDILAGLAWLGITHDGDIVRQSEQTERYTEHLNRLIASNAAYLSHEPSKEDPTKEVDVVRLRNPGRTLTFTDEVRGDITFDTTELHDFVIARSPTDPLYHFAVVVDDASAGVTHVIRGEDHISNTPRQILIQEALGFPRPVYAHLPLILAPDRSKLSKRKGATSVVEYRAQGFLPEAMVNYLALLGWNPGTDQEVFTMDELVASFSLAGIQKGGAVFDMQKLMWMNREHRNHLSPEARRSLVGEALRDTLPLKECIERSPGALADILERFATHAELRVAVQNGEFDFYTVRPTLTRDRLAWKKDTSPERLAERLTAAYECVASVPNTDFTADRIKNAVWEYAEREGRGAVLWPLRYALSGRDQSPNPFIIAEALGKEETLARLRIARDL